MNIVYCTQKHSHFFYSCCTIDLLQFFRKTFPLRDYTCRHVHHYPYLDITSCYTSILEFVPYGLHVFNNTGLHFCWLHFHRVAFSVNSRAMSVSLNKLPNIILLIDSIVNCSLDKILQAIPDESFLCEMYYVIILKFYSQNSCLFFCYNSLWYCVHHDYKFLCRRLFDWWHRFCSTRMAPKFCSKNAVARMKWV